MVPTSKSMSHEAHLLEKNLLPNREVFCDSPIRIGCTLLGQDLNFLRWSTILLSGINEDQTFQLFLPEVGSSLSCFEVQITTHWFHFCQQLLRAFTEHREVFKISSNLLIIDTHE